MVQHQGINCSCLLLLIFPCCGYFSVCCFSSCVVLLFLPNCLLAIFRNWGVVPVVSLASPSNNQVWQASLFPNSVPLPLSCQITCRSVLCSSMFVALAVVTYCACAVHHCHGDVIVVNQVAVLGCDVMLSYSIYGSNSFVSLLLLSQRVEFILGCPILRQQSMFLSVCMHVICLAFVSCQSCCQVWYPQWNIVLIVKQKPLYVSNTVTSVECQYLTLIYQ